MRVIPSPKALAEEIRSTLLGATFILFLAAFWHMAPPTARAQTATSEHVIYVSVDGLRADAISNLGPSNLPTFYRFINEGASTLNARNDPDYTITLPNHTSMLTGRFVSGSAGHNWTKNTDPSPGETIHSNAGSYISSVFDVFHDEGFKTSIFATKSKFEIFFNSWDENNGALDTVLPDYGRSKIDATGFESSSMDVVQSFITSSGSGSFTFSFLHLYDPDHVGHFAGWDPQLGSVYAAAVMDADAALGALLSFVESSPAYQGKTTIILTSDHGGVNLGHSDPLNVLNYTIPFIVWGKGVEPGTDLYALNPLSRVDPGTTHVSRSETLSVPIRNADGANLALSLLGLPPIPGSTINPKQDLTLGNTSVTEPTIQVAFQDGVSPSSDYQGTRDTKIISEVPTTVFGSDPVLEMDAEPDYGVLVSWDLLSVPTNATVSEATLVFDITNVTGLDYEYYAVKRWWEEETATWVRANSGENWQLPGALGDSDRSGTSLGSITASTTGTFRFKLGNDALAVVQQWVSDPGSNYGLIFQDYTSGDDGLDMSSREATDPTKRPRLELSYSTEPVVADPEAPTALFEMTLTRGAGSGSGSVEFSADASASTDSNGSIVSYEWAFGDGSTGSGADVTHTFSNVGTYRVVLTVTDNSGLTSRYARLVKVDAAGQNQVAFQDGAQPSNTYSGTRDTKILAGFPTSNFGSIDFLETDGSPRDVSLVQWDVSAIPPGVTVTSASLVFEVVDPSNENYGVYPLSTRWDEYTATWERASGSASGDTPGSILWNAPGAAGSADFAATKLANLGPAELGAHTVSLNAAGRDLVASWINDPASNFGLVLRDYAGSGDGLDVASREAAVSSHRPRLELTYTNEMVVVDPVDPDTTSSAPPVAAFTMTLVRNAGSIAVTTDASASTAAESISSYEWTFAGSVGSGSVGSGTGDADSGGVGSSTGSPGGSSPATASGATASHSFQDVGTHTVTLKITDNTGATDTLVRPVIVDVHGENNAGFQDGVSPVTVYAGTRDTKILSGSKTANFGSDTFLEMDGSPQNASMVKWDLQAIAPGVDVLEVTLHFDVTDPSGENYGLFGLLRTWEETASTWMVAAKGSLWQLDGANGETDFGPDLLADLGPAPTGPLSVSLNEAGRNLVESWINAPSTNHGFVLRDYTNSQDGLDLASRESTILASRPRIDIRYQSQHHAELPQKLRIGAYPNPFYDELTVDLASPITHEVQLELYDMLGRRVTNHTIGAGQVSGPVRLNTSTLSAGVYALRVTEHGALVSTTQLVTKGY